MNEFDAMIAETNDRIRRNMAEVIDIIDLHPEGDIDPLIRLIEHQCTSRRTQIRAKKLHTRDDCERFALKGDGNALA